MKKRALTFCAGVLLSCHAGPLTEYDKRIAQERRAGQYSSQAPISAQPIAHIPTQHFEYPRVEPLPAHVQASIENETDLLDEIKNSISNLIEWFTS